MIKIRDSVRPVTQKLDDYDEKYMKIKFDSDDKVPLNKTIEILVIVIVARAVFDKNKNLFPSFFRRMFIRIIKML